MRVCVKREGAPPSDQGREGTRAKGKNPYNPNPKRASA